MPISDPAIFGAGAALVAILALIAWIDLRRLVIPNVLNLSLALGGLAFQSAMAPDWLAVQLVAAAGFMGLFWAVRFAHSATRGQVGLGLGDVKMAGAGALWISPWNLPWFLLAASGSALLAAGAGALLSPNRGRDARMPFGPFLAAGLLAVWLMENGYLAHG